MNRSLFFAIGYTLAALMLVACAQRGFDNPLGVTGGSYGGYGYSRDYYRDNRASKNASNNTINGVWQDSEITVTLNIDGTFAIKSAKETRIGTFGLSKDILILYFKDGNSRSYSFVLSEDRLTLEEI
jgi:hypothetical protein